jgi:membrane protein implicated in regulation of membrane protease activity
MDAFLSAPALWFLIGFAFFLLEFAVPGFILFFFGIGSWIVALATLFTDFSLNTQILIFLSSSILTVAIFRNWVRKKLGTTSFSKYVLEDEIIGKIAKAETPIIPGEGGRVYFKGTSWKASSTEKIRQGDNVIIIANESIHLIVKPTQSS